MKFRQTFFLSFCLIAISASSYAQSQQAPQTAVPLPGQVRPLNLENVKIQDAFWSPKLKTWDSKTVYDVFDKLEGQYVPDRPDLVEDLKKSGRTLNAFLNFDLVAQGKSNINQHDGPPWYDGLVYETIRGAADLLVAYPDPKLEQKIDKYILRIAAAQAANKDGYVNTYTTLMRPAQEFGLNGGDERWQHDIYNAGMLMEAAVHYYKATGKTKLLDVAVRFANYICLQMGPDPKRNIIPGHGGPEEAMLKLYQLFKADPALKSKVTVPVNEQEYYAMVKFWIEDRGHYANADGSNPRTNFGAYNQDHMPVLEQQTLEGHAVRATLLATGVAATALENHDPKYIQTANNYWNNMVGKRMFITGGQGAIADDEKFGPDYFLPESAYLETCASMGSAFFSQRMNEMQSDGKYMDEFERVIYNNMLSSVSQDGDHYHYENPLIATRHPRWAWHSCPCCPPMFLKLVGALPQYIYAQDDKNIFVNLFIGSDAEVDLDKRKVFLKQETEYPWKGKTKVTVNPETPGTFVISIRIPGWATGKENPFDLYTSSVSGKVSLKVNGQSVAVNPANGYAAISRNWTKGDVVELDLPMQPRLVSPHPEVKTIAGKMAIASGPVIYALEGLDNPDMTKSGIFKDAKMQVTFRSDLMGGINVISGKATNGASAPITFTAIPFYATGNRGTYPYQVWLAK
jgi:DUF1680 family protein